jgi:hypothetical protein
MGILPFGARTLLPDEDDRRVIATAHESLAARVNAVL